MPRPRKKKAQPPAPPDPATAYAQAVASGQVIAGQFVRQACERHLRDLADGPQRGLTWHPEKAQVLFDFFGLLRHYKGRWAGQPIALEPWQKFALGSLWGWRRADGSRRFRTFHLEVGRKNGKTTIAGGLALALEIIDKEPGAEVYAAATKKDQARLSFTDAKMMVEASAVLKKMVTVNKDNLSVTATASKFEPLSSEGGKLDGLNVHGAICDELHAWKQRLLWDVLETAAGARTQPLFCVTTTAGTDRLSIWWELREKAIKVLERTFDDDRLLALIYTLDDGDDWKDESKYTKANPNLGASLRLEDLVLDRDDAVKTPGKQNPFIRLRLNRPTEQADRWLVLEQWDACAAPIPEERLHGRECYGGLDLSQSLDIAAWVIVFPPIDADRRWRVLGRFFLPDERMHQRVVRDRVPYDQWAAEDLLIMTEGNVIDYDAIEARIKEDAALFSIKELAFDRFFATQIILRLMDEGINCIAFGQGFASMAAPTKRLGELIANKDLAHPGTKIWRWMAGNVAVKQDPAGNLKPDKSASSDKIDGIVATIMAIGRAIAEPVQDEPSLFYE